MEIPMMTGVQSSNIDEVGYEDGQLFVRFKNNALFMYDNVPESEYERFVSADSVGRYFMLMIKGAYRATKIE